ncbi:MAG: kinase/pyrophosphorylase [Alphaproteobacteria bacterium]|nr:kinase/pyrophosphorylase [Alphaproteobacteria bacterium]
MEGRFFLHLVSDATGTTLHGVARACLAQFEVAAPIEKFWNFIRTEEQLEQVIEGIAEAPGPVLFTLVEKDLRRKLRDACTKLQVPAVPVLDPVLRGLSVYLGQATKDKPGGQYELNAAYFERIDAVDFAIHHDDGQHLETIDDAEVILVGASRTSKTPTCFYLANRGIKAANIPLVPGVPVPPEAFEHKGPLYVGLVETPERLVELRRNRLKSGETLDAKVSDSKYLALDAVEDEIRKARKLFSTHGWPVIDVTRRSVEETSAEIMILFNRHHPERMLI